MIMVVPILLCSIHTNTKTNTKTHTHKKNPHTHTDTHTHTQRRQEPRHKEGREDEEQKPGTVQLKQANIMSFLTTTLN